MRGLAAAFAKPAEWAPTVYWDLKAGRLQRDGRHPSIGQRFFRDLRVC